MQASSTGKSIKSTSRLLKAGLLCLFFLAAVFMKLAAQGPVHDPSTIVKGDDDRYYVFSTGDGIYGLSSSNPQFTNHQEEPTPLDPNNHPTWIDSYVTDFGGNFWAPDLIYMEGYYYLYYSASSFGTSRSVIGVTRTPSLANPTWEDQGLVVSSNGSNTAINAIDPALMRDTDGKIWMSYGSYFGGIGVIEIDPSTGKTLGSLTKIAGGSHRDYEAPFILKNGSYYYLFINRGRCCQLLNSTYYVEVSRSTSITGPYSGVREFLPVQTGNIVGPGHIGYGEGVMSYHYYDGFSNGYPRLFTTTLEFVDGWPVAGPTGVEMAEINGQYALIASHSDKAVTMAATPPVNGTNIMQNTYVGDETQKFIITNEEGIWHSIKPANNTNLSFDVFEVSTENGANINLWEYWGNAQQFSFMVAPGGGYRSSTETATAVWMSPTPPMPMAPTFCNGAALKLRRNKPSDWLIFRLPDWRPKRPPKRWCIPIPRMDPLPFILMKTRPRQISSTFRGKKSLRQPFLPAKMKSTPN
ncbi:arabinan endo-1,5-alpha-L-arabinosidase [Geofilum rubicundum JCM 15548]|uniref:Arabinan endo-1,5-alpha-L-arabinosidase n=1 Tax=Geofilum rubicundum JCM 15548 TaxID=1236989 RepID=A0A0E9LXB1_9BACT|nr:family 43 glycosylhydrolase [Geofilum rubicundum]GAO30222.1 arabinan endo-1,5-alpha-L-arabinosidase [Geofilum rubicundum JCM 15548]